MTSLTCHLLSPCPPSFYKRSYRDTVRTKKKGTFPPCRWVVACKNERNTQVQNWGWQDAASCHPANTFTADPIIFDSSDQTHLTSPSLYSDLIQLSLSLWVSLVCLNCTYCRCKPKAANCRQAQNALCVCYLCISEWPEYSIFFLRKFISGVSGKSSQQSVPQKR